MGELLVYQRVYKKPIQGNCAIYFYHLLPWCTCEVYWGIRYPGPTPKGSRRSRLPTINFHRLFAVSFKYGNHGSMENGPFGDKTRLVQAPFSADPSLWLFNKLVHQQKPAGSTKQTLTDIFKTCLFCSPRKMTLEKPWTTCRIPGYPQWHRVELYIFCFLGVPPFWIGLIWEDPCETYPVPKRSTRRKLQVKYGNMEIWSSSFPLLTGKKNSGEALYPIKPL